jgi:hypothetical protein
MTRPPKVPLVNTARLPVIAVPRTEEVPAEIRAPRIKIDHRTRKTSAVANHENVTALYPAFDAVCAFFSSFFRKPSQRRRFQHQ